VGVSVKALMGILVSVAVRECVEVGAEVGVTTVAVGVGVVLIALLQAEPIMETKINANKDMYAFIGFIQYQAMPLYKL
jgi:hypothetical protein